MKANAITRIVIYSILILLLVGILCAGLGQGLPFIQLGQKGTPVYGEVKIAPNEVSSLSIDWIAGSILITAADTDSIIISEEGEKDNNRMSYRIEGDTLHLSYSDGFHFGFFSTPTKKLNVIVPRDWNCAMLEIDGASLRISTTDLTIGTLELDGASNQLSISGSIEKLDCDGASNSITMNCANRPSNIDLDGASCKLNLTLPKDCGFRAELDGINCDLNSHLPYSHRDDYYAYGDEYCHITTDGISCDITISHP
ncbi:MAG: hypothetical protein IJV82_03350 [Oscillospiraceae bacterium]|nr:hypothetical protein [Oscillospiraceae bacterium]